MDKYSAARAIFLWKDFIGAYLARYVENKNSLFYELVIIATKPLVVPVNQIHHLPMNSKDTNLTGKLLVAMPAMGDPRFEHSVVYISSHSRDGAMGLIVNKPNLNLELKTLLGHLNIPVGVSTPDVSVYFGGPVDQSRGFLLHSAEYSSDPDTLRIDADFAVTATVDVLKELSQGGGPKTSLLVLGYSGWSAGQLEVELLSNGWLICDASFELVFELAAVDKWAGALASLGVDPMLLSAQSGRA